MAFTFEAVLRSVLKAGLNSIPPKTATTTSYVESIVLGEGESFRKIWDLYKSGRLSEGEYRRLLEELRDRLTNALFFENLDNEKVAKVIIKEFDQILHGGKPPDFP